MNRSRVLGGLALIILGLLFLLDSTGVTEFRTLIRTYWPVILILAGIALLSRTAGGRKTAPSPAGIETESLRHSSVFGDLHVAVTSASFSGGSASTVFGDVAIDLTRATLRDGQSLLRLSGVLGSISVYLPEGMEYAVSLQVVLGDLKAGAQRQEGFSARLQYQTPGYAHSSRTLMITASQVLGDISVRT